MQSSSALFIQVENLDHIKQAISLRMHTLVANFSSLSECEAESLSGLAVSELPVLEEGIDPTLLSQLLDYGRANSAIPFRKKSLKFFDDGYHRDAIASTEDSFNLIKNSLVLKGASKNDVLIPVAKFLVPLITFFMTTCKESPKYAFQNSADSYPFLNSNLNCLFSIPKEYLENVMIFLGSLGALPNRDMQIKYFLSSKIKNKKYSDFKKMNLAI